MQPDAFCYLFLSITVTAFCVQAQENRQYVLQDQSQEKRLSKREAAIFIDNFPIIPISSYTPSVTYRRVSKQRYRIPKPIYGPPVKIYRSSKPRKHFKKYTRPVKPKYGPPSYKKRPTRTNYSPPKLLKYKPVYGPPKNPYSSYYASEPDFGEPPNEYVSDFQSHKKHFGEPPTDSYGTPLHTGVNEPHVSDYYSIPTSFSDPPTGLENLENFGKELGTWQSFKTRNQNFDNSFAYSKKRPVFIKPESFEGQEVEEDSISYADIHPHKDSSERDPLPFKKKRKPLHTNFQSWRPPKHSQKPEEVLVGGRYAEPPAKYVNKPKSTASLNTDDDEFPWSNDFIDPDVAISATSSPYVNYKNSNMAFSPQNLNDAFSIVDK